MLISVAVGRLRLAQKVLKLAQTQAVGKPVENAVSAAELRGQILSAAIAHEARQVASRAAHFAAYHSETLPWLLSFVTTVSLDRDAGLCATGICDTLLQLIAATSLLLATLPTLVAILAIAVYIPLAAALPLVQPLLLFSRGTL